ncbi:hypothetical protein [Limibacterium fermenti]|uniref:hypothetical protein n=1 Tax=Limibacterium fermenti TaxID=3229863 RepID=UPI003A657F99
MHEPVTIWQLCSIMYRNSMYFGQREAAKIVGGRTQLERLVAEGKVRAEKPSPAQNGKWYCNAGDVIYYAKDVVRKKRTKKNKQV